ncbi:sterol desaturase family protein [Geobacter sp. SVR]|uniref:sterol desaturase family protein n=1 Tax=Geobacter sp. SVR TaxID=2495594 RepID=UPI00143F0344|nr:sterol desaturase family protein [Geobacter sp. SVR]BCS53351.1 sterol desaturase [Geobacter sp. SVR]GCF85523.1 sterol desaturase [Geobacter sp. SVR]
MPDKRDVIMREPPSWLNALLVVGTLATIVWLESRRPLRRMRQDRLWRTVRNLSMSAMTATTVALAEKPITAHLTLAVQRHRWGLLKLARLPAWLELLFSVILLDYTLYIWHYLTHKVPPLWRFHQAHHVDLDLDASTALRFHAGEMLLSAPWRGTQVLLLGISPLGLAVWQTLTLMEIMFHHSNLQLPIALERRLSRLIVTPRMHGIHHSIVRQETDSNWSTIFSWPDRLHGTLRLNVPQQAITIGVPAFQDPAELTLGRVMALPFKDERPGWRLAGDGEPQREPQPLPLNELAE